MKNDAEKSEETEAAEEEKALVTIGDFSIEIARPKRRQFIKKTYKGRETISASIPGWIKAALDLLASTTDKYKGFGGKSRFIAEAIEAKLKEEFPDLYQRFKKLSQSF